MVGGMGLGTLVEDFKRLQWPELPKVSDPDSDMIKVNWGGVTWQAGR